MEISVIIPVYNASKWLKKLWDSLLNQTIFDKLEIIFVNDGSSDDSCDVINEITKSLPNVKIINQSNHGVSFTRNIGINNSTCQYITFIDADDFLDYDYFENLLDHSKDGEIVITGFVNDYGSKNIEKKPIKYEILTNNNEIVKDFLIGKIEPNSTNKLFSKSIIGNLRFNETYAIAEDKLFVYKYLKKINSAVFIPEAKYHYNHMNENAATKSSFNNKKLASTKVSEEIVEDIKNDYHELLDYALSADIDVKCRVFCDIYKHKAKNKYLKEYKLLRKEIKSFSLIKKVKFSSKKHFFTLLLAKIHPSLYIFAKDGLKLQFK